MVVQQSYDNILWVGRAGDRGSWVERDEEWVSFPLQKPGGVGRGTHLMRQPYNSQKITDPLAYPNDVGAENPWVLTDDQRRHHPGTND